VTARVSPPKQPSRRAIVEAQLRIAGYHDDDAAWVRAYVGGRISIARARALQREGAELRRRGMPCSCSDCRAATVG
jgi:hypothetical protein